MSGRGKIGHVVKQLDATGVALPDDVEIARQVFGLKIRVQLLHWFNNQPEPAGSRTVEKELGISVKAAERCLRELADFGVLDRCPTPPGEVGNRYTLNRPARDSYLAAFRRFLDG